MYDLIHAAIATERVRDLVDTAEVKRATRKPRRNRTKADPSVRGTAKPAPRAAWMTEILRLRS
jgi:hypothetical protein